MKSAPAEKPAPADKPAAAPAEAPKPAANAWKAALEKAMQEAGNGGN